MVSFLRLPARAGHKKDSEKKPAPGRTNGLRLSMGVGVVLILSILLSLHLLPDKVSMQVGDICREEIVAHRTVRYLDTMETDRMRQEAAASADKVYRIVPKASADAAASLSNIFEIFRRARNDVRIPTLIAKDRYVRRNLSEDIGAASVRDLLLADARTFDSVEAYSKQLAQEAMDREIRDDTSDIHLAHEEFEERILNYLGKKKVAKAAVEIGCSVIRPNRIYDAEATKAARAREAESVPPQYRQIIAGDVIIGKDERVTPRHIDEFTALGLRNPRMDYITALCIALLVIGVVVTVILYIARYHSIIYQSIPRLMLLSLIVVISVLGLKLGGTILGLKLTGVQFGCFIMIWIATAGMLTAALLSADLAVLVIAMLSTTTGLAMNHELRWALASLVSSLVAIYTVSNIKHSSDLMRTAGAVCAANLVLVWLIGRIGGDVVGDLITGSGWAVFGGVASVGLFWLGSSAMEKPFGITTHRRLLELSDTNNPIFKRLLMEAPGTYSHSIFVGNIAAMAAEKIGADALLVRVASYYHDIGKIKRPNFFVENQHVENVHDRLNPSLSALVIRSHIKDGLDLAREYGLPPVICELMSQHHGTSLVRYFFHRAATNTESDASVLEQQFRYDGVKPQSRESAILMLADAVEAASRALAKPTQGQIENMVDSIIAEKLADGQLDECDLTFKDINRIRASFDRTLTSMLHARIEYPEICISEGKIAIGNGSAGKELPAGEGGHGQAGDSGKDNAAV